MGGIVDKVFGNNIPDQVKNPTLVGFQSPGLGVSYDNPWTMRLNRGDELQTNLNRLSGVFNRQASRIEGLRPLIAPGFSRFRDAGIAEIEASRRSTLGDLRQNLARRRVLGSSFAGDDITRANLEFDKRRNAFETDAFLKELAATQSLIDSQAQAEANTVINTINQANLESQLAANLASNSQTIFSNNAAIQAQMANTGADRLLNVVGTVAGGGLSLSNPFSNPTPPATPYYGNPGAIQPGTGFWTT